MNYLFLFIESFMYSLIIFIGIYVLDNAFNLGTEIWKIIVVSILTGLNVVVVLPILLRRFQKKNKGE
jgi:uncharacterized membrane protein YfhO